MIKNLLLALALLPTIAFGSSDVRTEKQETLFQKGIAFTRRDESGSATQSAMATTTSYIKLASVVSTVYGMAAPASTQSPKLIIVSNMTGSTVTFAHESASASATNRFVFTDDLDLEIKNRGSASFIYDHGQNRWVLAGGSGGGSGDVEGPASSTQFAMPAFADTTGKLLMESNLFFLSPDLYLDANAQFFMRSGYGMFWGYGSAHWGIGKDISGFTPTGISGAALKLNCNDGANNGIAFGTGNGGATLFAQRCDTGDFRFFGAGTIDETLSMGDLIDMGGNPIEDVADPTNAQDAATKNYVDTALAAFSGDAVKKNITQSSHGFSVGDWLYLNSTTYTLADSDAEATAEVVGVVSAVADANNFTLTTHGYVSGLAGLTAGTAYYLSGTAGDLTATEPTGYLTVSKPVFIADSTTSGIVINYRGIINGSAQSGSGAMIYFQEHAGYGSTDDKISYYTNVVDQSNAQMSYVNGTVNGAQVTILEPGIYCYGNTVSYSSGAQAPSGVLYAAPGGSITGTTNPPSVTAYPAGPRIAFEFNAGGHDQAIAAQGCFYFAKGSKIAGISNGAGTLYSTPMHSFWVVKLSAGSSPQKMYWSGTHAGDCAWQRASASFGDTTSDGSCTFATKKNRHGFTVVSADSGGSPIDGIVVTFPKNAQWRVCAKTPAAGNSGMAWSVQLWDGTTSMDSAGVSAPTGFTQNPQLCGLFDGSATTSATFKMRFLNSTGTLDIGGSVSNGELATSWEIMEL